ncbi:MAG: alpha/beta fold hydrolase [Betaproteobacteria bacterium]|jgi:pimeloyl-ACP methyl ester carboxylesterase|nr:alpha/beta fold hydrolase [Betaproteobacteria bacterium]NBP34323.1 alpha/beta fold hydrolase [Betaproteobacteria bacterium]NBQ77603.1 alpha/beta fold hydrolase [Betaproteobacteria bacterium]NBS38332.1 alpha/beta fold hydrolase [Betaproteobacteria bacterium]NBY54340.1 alpha/beta fold hydrolase [Betaproteobacteria bacterium]
MRHFASIRAVGLAWPLLATLAQCATIARKMMPATLLGLDEGLEIIENMRARGESIHTPGLGEAHCPIHWMRFGEGPDCVLLHGGHGSWMHWLNLIPLLSGHYRLWIPDLPGFGASGDMLTPAETGFMAQALILALDHLGVSERSFTLGGFSFGGLVAGQMLAQGAPVQSLRLVGSAGMGMRPEKAIDMLLWQRARSPEDLLEAYRHNLKALMLHRDEDISALALAIHAESCRQTRWRSREASHQAGLRDIIRQARVPVHAVWGLQDPTMDPKRLTTWWDESISAKGETRQSLSLWDDCGHWIMHQSADKLASWFKEHA